MASFWRKEIIFIANILPAIVNFFTSLLLAKFIGFELAGLWFFLRSLSQISVSISPGFLQALLIKSEKFTFEKDILPIAKILSIIWSLINFLFFLLCIKLIGTETDSIINYLICVYWVSLTIYNYFSVVLRIKLDGKSILVLSIFDTFMSLLILFSLFYVGLEWFILFNSIKFFIKAILAKYLLDKNSVPLERLKSLTISSYIISSKELFKTGGGLSFKGIIQTLSQYGDKFVFGIILSNELLGFVSLGSALGLPLAILLSSFYAWSLPYLKNEKYLFENANIFSLLFIFILFYPLSAFSLLIIYDFSPDNFLLVFCSLVFMMLQVILNFSCALLFKKYGTWLSSLFQLIIIIICYLLVYICYQLGVGLIQAISIGSLFLLISTTCVLIKPFKSKALYVLLLGLYLVYPLTYF
jgi:hypothetical protein